MSTTRHEVQNFAELTEEERRQLADKEPNFSELREMLHNEANFSELRETLAQQGGKG